ncbi:MAG: DUF885 domain-containing protein [Oligoflexia bacterium]|nr:DUF885 domain-containing protein [Oligoflexia bacterium]
MLPIVALLLACTPAHPAATRPVATLASPAPAPAPAPTPTPTPTPTPRISTLPLPGDPPYAVIAHDLIAVRVALAPSLAAEAGLYQDALVVPSYAPDAVSALLARVDQDLAGLQALPWDELSTDQQIDTRWLYAQGELLREILTVERPWEHRPAQWLEPVGYALVALAVADPDRESALLAGIPAMVDEMRAEITKPTARDVRAATEIIDGLLGVIATAPPGPQAEAASAALRAYADQLSALSDLPEYQVIGAEAYAWRLEHALLLPWTPDELLALAGAELDRVDAELASLGPPAPLPPTQAEQAEAQDFTRDTLLALYDDAVKDNLAALRRMDIVTVPDDLPPILARETPPPAIPLAGDGGSMNPPPLYGPPQPGHWNVQTFRSDWTVDQRLSMVQTAREQGSTWFGYYAVHEGVPGHHLQLALARSIGNPVRTLLTDTPSVEGWALYAEQAFWEGGVRCTQDSGTPCGFGDSDAARRNMLNSYRARIRRVFYDVKVETGRWTLQEAADWRAGAEGVEVDRDVLRAINWPTQLIAYFAGKEQLIELRQQLRDQRGLTDRQFNDAVLAEGQIPIALIRAKLLGEPIPSLP